MYIFCLTIQLLTDNRAISSFVLLQVNPLHMFVCSSSSLWPGVQLLNCVIIACLLLKTLPDWLPEWLCHFQFLLAMYAWFVFHHPCQHLISSLCCCFFDIWIGMSWCLTAVLICFSLTANKGIPSDWVVKNPPTNAGDVGSILGFRRSSGGGNGNPLQYYCLGNLMDREAWQAIVCGVTKDSNMA